MLIKIEILGLLSKVTRYHWSTGRPTKLNQCSHLHHLLLSSNRR